MEFYSRILEIQNDVSPHSQRAFEISIGKTSGYLNMMKKNKGKPSVEVVLKIIEVYPKYNLYWIFGLSNEKYIDNDLNTLKEPTTNYGLSFEVDHLKLLLEAKNDIIKAKEETISELRNQLEIKQASSKAS